MSSPQAGMAGAQAAVPAVELQFYLPHLRLYVSTHSPFFNTSFSWERFSSFPKMS